MERPPPTPAAMPPGQARVFAYHKPRRVLVSRRSEAGAPAVFDHLPETFRAWFAVGRLDKDSEGLLLFCNDSRLAQRLMDPDGLAKTYLVTVEGLPDEGGLDLLRQGDLELGARLTRPLEVRRLGKAPRGGTRLEMVLHEGINRQIRRSLLLLGHKVRRLIRIAVGPVQLGDLAAGEGRELAATEVADLVAALGPAAAPPAVSPGTARSSMTPSPRGR